MEEKTKKSNKKVSLLIKAVIVLVVVVIAFFLSQYVAEKNEKSPGSRRERQSLMWKHWNWNGGYKPMVEDDNAALVAFQQENPQRKVVLACEEDVTNDTLKDLLIIYKEDDPTEGEITRLVVSVAQQDGSYTYTEPIPAPIENQGIQFKNIDEEAEMEFIVSGEKDGAAGYAIYRMIDGQPMDLFGDGMEDCC